MLEKNSIKAEARRKHFEDLREKAKDFDDDFSEEKQELKQKIMKDFEQELDKKLSRMNDGEGLIHRSEIRIINQDYQFREELSRNDPEVKEWRRKVFERDDYTCQECGEKGGKIHAHHIEPWSEEPSKRLEIDNGITLCIECHSEKHENPELIKKAKYHDRTE